MNKDEMLKQLSMYLRDFGEENFVFCSEFLRELRELLLKNVDRQDLFFTQFVTALHNIRDFKHNIYQIDGHEKLKSCSFPCYSIHLASKGYNVRFLISFLSDETPVFLLAFYERSGKARTGYEKEIKKAKKRLSDIREVYNG